jgi:sulfur carrier protein
MVLSRACATFRAIVVGVEMSVLLIVNGEPVETAATTLAGLLVERGLSDAKIATAVNGGFVAARAREAQPLVSGDRVEILSPRQGG